MHGKTDAEIAVDALERASEMELRYDLITLDVKRLQEEKDAAYAERDQLVAALSKLFPSHLCRHPDEDEKWEDTWRNIVCIHFPTGDGCWHITDDELPWFDHLEMLENHWDGYTVAEKYERLARLKPGEF